jgi:hypothetical protein
MKVGGQYPCGQITFEAEIDPEAARICHCTELRPSRQIGFRSAQPDVGDVPQVERQ